MRPVSVPRLLTACLLLAGLAASPASAQVPGAYPHLVLENSQGVQAPPSGGPFDNSGVLQAPASSVIDVTVTYQAVAQPNTNVLWGLLFSVDETGFPKTTTPPPLLTQPPFQVLVPGTLDTTGTGALQATVPAGLFDAEVYVQAVTYDTTSIPNLQLSNGLRVEATPPRFNVAFGFSRLSFGLTPFGMEGLASRDLDGDTLNTLAPVGPNAPPDTATTPQGIAPGFRFLPIVPNVADAPVNPMARPITRLTVATDGATGLDEFVVEDASFFPPSGELYIQQAGENPYAGKTAGGGNSPNLERATYTGRTIDPVTGMHKFTGVRRALLGSTGNNSYPHQVGELVFGEWSYVSSPAARSRERVALDATHDDTPHVVIPAFTAALGEGVETRDQDLYLFEEVEAGRVGFAVYDRLSRSWHVIEDSVITTGFDRFWDPMVSVAPDGRSFIATQRIGGGPQPWDSDPDELYAIRLDGLDWPASGSEVWQISFEDVPDPTPTDDTANSRHVYMPSVAILGPDPANYVAYVGLKNKWRQSSTGNSFDSELGYEGYYIPEEVIVTDYIEVPLVPPGSTKSPPSMPRPFITDAFGLIGNGLDVVRFDPVPFVVPDSTRMYVTVGGTDRFEDVVTVRNITVNPDGTVSRAIQNVTGHGTPGSNGATNTWVLHFENGGHGTGGRFAVSPSGARIAYLRRETPAGDFLMVARTNGADYANVQPVYRATNAKFQEPGVYPDDHVISGIYFAGEDDVVFLMGDNPHSDAIGLSTEPRYDIFRYTISTDTVVNLTKTSESANDFDALGRIVPAGHWQSDDKRFIYYVRSGAVSQGNTTLPAETPVTNVVGINTQTWEVFDVTGDEFGLGAGVPNMVVPDDEAFLPVETVAGMGFVEGTAAQDGLVYFTGHVALDATETDEIFAVDAEAPFVSLEVTAASPAGSHISNLAPSPNSALIAFARTGGADRWAATQHPFVVDLDNFLFERDLTPTFQSGGQPFGRVVDGSLHFIPPTSGAGEALVFSAGNSVFEGSFGTAQNTSTVYTPLANVSDPVAEPLPLLIPLLSTNNLGAGYRIYVLSAAASPNE